MHVCPIHLKQANEFVAKYHRHHKTVVGYKFAVGAKIDDELVGVAICGRPVARKSDDGLTLEVTRLCTTGEPNACSMLYSACARVAKEMGYKKIITFILEKETGISLKASNWKFDGFSRGNTWNMPSRPRIDKHPLGLKKRFVLNFEKKV